MSQKPLVHSGELTSFSEYCFHNPEFAMSYAERRLNLSSEIPSVHESQLQSFALLRQDGGVRSVIERITVRGEGYTITPSIVATVGRTSEVNFLKSYYDEYGPRNYLETIGYSVLYERGIIGDEEASVRISIDDEEKVATAVTYINGILVEYRDVDPHYTKIKTPESGLN